MENELYIEGLGVSVNVVETIVSLAVSEVEGAAGIGSSSTISGIKAVLCNTRSTSTGIEVTCEDGKISISMRMQVYYGYKLTAVAAAVRQAISDAILSQVGVEVASVDIFVDGIVFQEQ